MRSALKALIDTKSLLFLRDRNAHMHPSSQYLHSVPLRWLLTSTLFTDSIVLSHQSNNNNHCPWVAHFLSCHLMNPSPCIEAPRKLTSSNVISTQSQLQLCSLQGASVSTDANCSLEFTSDPLFLLLWKLYFTSCLSLILLITSYSFSKFCSVVSDMKLSVLHISLDISLFCLPCWLLNCPWIVSLCS